MTNAEILQRIRHIGRLETNLSDLASSSKLTGEEANYIRSALDYISDYVDELESKICK